MGEGLAEGVTVVSVIAGEGVDYGVALGLEHQQVAVLGHGLLEGGGGAVGGDAQQLDGRLDRRVDVLSLLLPLVPGVLLLVLLLGGEPAAAEFHVDGLDQAVAEVQLALAGAGGTGDEEVAVRKDGLAEVDGTERQQTGTDGDDAADENQAAFLGREHEPGGLGKQVGKVGVDGLREQRKFRDGLGVIVRK